MPARTPSSPNLGKTAADHNRAHTRFEKAVGGEEGFNRLHPLRRVEGEPFAPGRNETVSQERVEGRDPGEAREDDARDQRFVTPLVAGDTYQRIKDALGSVSGGGAAQRSGGETAAIEAEFLLATARALIEAARARAAAFPAGRSRP